MSLVLALAADGVSDFGASGGALVPLAPRPVSPEPMGSAGSPFSLVEDGGLLWKGAGSVGPVEAAYRVFEDIPEIKQQVRRNARILSRCRWVAEEWLPMQDGEFAWQPAVSSEIHDACRQFVHPNGSESALSYEWAQHWQIGGMVWVGGAPDPVQPRRWRWGMLAGFRAREHPEDPGMWQVRNKRGSWEGVSKNRLYLSERREANPSRPWESDSWVMGLTSLAYQLMILDDLVAAISMSNISFGQVSSSIEWHAGVEDADELTDKEVKELAANFRKQLTTSLREFRQHRKLGQFAGPRVMLGPAKHLETAFKHERVALEFQQMIVDMQRYYIERVARSMDSRAEELLGKGELNQWGAYEAGADENENVHAPMGGEYAQHVTSAVIRPWLQLAYGWDGERAATARIVCDTGPIRARQDLSRASREVNQLVPLDEESIVSRNGLDPSDMERDPEKRLHWRISRLLDKSPVRYLPLIKLLPEFAEDVIELPGGYDDLFDLFADYEARVAEARGRDGSDGEEPRGQASGDGAGQEPAPSGSEPSQLAVSILSAIEDETGVPFADHGHDAAVVAVERLLG